jgi:hypothetical protein
MVLRDLVVFIAARLAKVWLQFVVQLRCPWCLVHDPALSAAASS